MLGFRRKSRLVFQMLSSFHATELERKNRMMTRICLIMAILASLAVGGLNMVRIKGKITGLQSELGTQIAARQAVETDLAKTRSNLENTSVELKQTRGAFEAAKAEKAKALAE